MTSIITGEKFQYLCDCYIGLQRTFQKTCHIYNSTLYESKIVTLENIVDNKLLLESSKIFIYTDVIYLDKGALAKIMSELNKKKNSFILIFHNSDYTVDSQFVPLTQLKHCKKLFAQNTIMSHEKIQYLPIGIANSKWKHGNKQLLNEIISKNIDKENKIFFNFSRNTNKRKRNLCYEKLKLKLKFEEKFDSQTDYLESLARCKFCIVPEGNGYDTHRLWECLYLKTIPICLSNTFSEMISKDFPLHLISNWEGIEPNTIVDTYSEYVCKIEIEKLDFLYWKDIIDTALCT